MRHIPVVVWRPRFRPGFTLVEALVAISITALAGSALMMGTTAALQTTHDARDQTIAMGLAQQLMDEIVGGRYCELNTNAYDTTLGPGASEAAKGTRELFDDIDDYNAVRTQPPKDAWGVALGKDDGLGGVRHPNFQSPAGVFDKWRQEVDVYYVSTTDPMVRLAAGQTSDYRAVEVRILRDETTGVSRELARLRRVVVYVPPLP